jgi:Mg-chelatase subunit ChlD
MTITTKNPWNFDSIYKTACHYASGSYHSSLHWVTTHCSQAYSKLPPLRPLATRYASISFHTGKGLLWRYKVVVISGCSLIGVALLIRNYMRKNSFRKAAVREVKKPAVRESKKKPDIEVEKKPEEKTEDRLVVKMEPTLWTKLSIEIPKQQHVPPPPNVSLTFCIDLSGSMDVADRIGAVRKSLLYVLNDAQTVVNNRKGAKISLSLIGFSNDSTVITPITQIISTYPGYQNGVLEGITKQIGNFKVGGGTDILRGLEQATEEVERAASTNKQGSHTLILLTDGEDNRINEAKLLNIQDKLASIPAKLFAIGIGSAHNRSILEKIAVSRNGNLKGTYTDTTLGIDTIESAISKIYSQAIASFHDLELSVSGLPPDAWSIIDTRHARGQSTWNLGSLSEEQTLEKVVEVHLDRLAASLDLSKVVFTLTFVDSNGKRGQLAFPWNPKITNGH